jgi:ABC-2 type transport system permease protein
LVESGPVSGRLFYPQLVQRSFFGVQLNRDAPHQPDEKTYVLAALVEGDAPGPDAVSEGEAPGGATGEEAEAGADGAAGAARRPLRLAVIADLDFISEQFFQIRAAGPANLNFDNVTFFLNSMDTLLGDESFVALRNRRVRHRTLERVETQTLDYLEQRAADERAAEEKAEEALKEAQQRLDEKVEAVRQRADLDAQTKQIMARNLQEVENRRFETLKASIESEKQAEISRSEERVEAQIRRIQSGIRTFAVLLPPIPVFAIGVVIFLRRQRREREGAAAARRLRS